MIEGPDIDVLAQILAMAGPNMKLGFRDQLPMTGNVQATEVVLHSIPATGDDIARAEEIQAEFAVRVSSGHSELHSVNAESNVITDLVEVIAKAVLGICTKIEVFTGLTAKIAAKVAMTILVIVQASLSVSIKVCVALMFAIPAEIDAASAV
ncbi:hypothetical protein FRC06_006750 [Ceratobasidium sp. 370]|nr:hypothetical protein FRC06_006750 [Ceratobasidium sp. 370]